MRPRSLLSRSFGLYLVVAALWLVAPSEISPARAAPWLKLDRVVAEPSWFEGIARVRVYVTAVTLEGGTIPIFGKKQWTLQLGSAKKNWPCIVGHFKAVEDELAIALVIETSDEFSEELPAIKAAAKEFIDKLPKTAQVGILGYSEEVEGDRRVTSKQKAGRPIDDLEADSIPVTELHLLDAVSKAVKLLKRAKPSSPEVPLRRIMVIVSDGLDYDPDPDNYRDAARKAEREDIRIHTMAYSRANRRRPMLGLAELSKRTLGTFRLVRSNVSFEPNFRQLFDEIEGQYILTYFLPVEAVTGKKLRVLANEIVSNDISVKKIACNEEECGSNQFCAKGACVPRPDQGGRGLLGWILVIAGGLVGLVIVLLGIGFLLSRRERKRAAATALAQAALEAQAAAAAEPSHRIVGQGPGGVAHPAAPAAPAVAAHPPVGRATAAPPYPAAAAGTPTLLILQGPRQGQRLPLRHGFTIGKAPNCDLVLADDSFASSHHAQFHMDAAMRCSIVDLHSTNGTFVNGVRAMEAKRLVGGEAIRVGSTEMRFLSQ